jgi:hypothetical protein
VTSAVGGTSVLGTDTSPGRIEDATSRGNCAGFGEPSAAATGGRSGGPRPAPTVGSHALLKSASLAERSQATRSPADLSVDRLVVRDLPRPQRRPYSAHVAPPLRQGMGRLLVRRVPCWMEESTPAMARPDDPLGWPRRCRCGSCYRGGRGRRVRTVGMTTAQRAWPFPRDSGHAS